MTKPLATLATALEIVVSRGCTAMQAQAVMTEVAQELRRIEEPDAAAAELALLLRRTLPFLEYIDRQSPWPETIGILQDIRKALGISKGVEK